MKLLKYLTFFLIISLSCNKNDNYCKYNLESKPKDTSLYISFIIDGFYMKYYQKTPSTDSYSGIFESKDNIRYEFLSYGVSFDSLNRVTDYYNSPIVNLTFWQKQKATENDNLYSHDIVSFFKNDLRYIDCINYTPIIDTIFLEGVSFDMVGFGIDEYITKIDRYYNYNIDSINNFYSDCNRVHFTNIQSVCNGYTLFEGTFSTKILYKFKSSNKTPIVLYVNDGRFRFIVKPLISMVQ